MSELIRNWPDLADRFCASVETRPGSECWWWMGGRNANGYGVIGVGQMKLLAHRLAWAAAHGEMPRGHALHRCDNPACVNPEHLFDGTQADNVADAVSKGRQARGRGFPHARLTDASVKEIRASSDPIRTLAKRYGVSYSVIQLARVGKTWKAV